MAGEDPHADQRAEIYQRVGEDMFAEGEQLELFDLFAFGLTKDVIERLKRCWERDLPALEQTIQRLELTKRQTPKNIRFGVLAA